MLIVFKADSLDQVCVADSLAAGLASAPESLHLTVLLGRVRLCLPRLDPIECRHFSKVSASKFTRAIFRAFPSEPFGCRSARSISRFWARSAVQRGPPRRLPCEAVGKTPLEQLKVLPNVSERFADEQKLLDLAAYLFGRMPATTRDWPRETRAPGWTWSTTMRLRAIFFRCCPLRGSQRYE
jgi:hypothetical protein